MANSGMGMVSLESAGSMSLMADAPEECCRPLAGILMAL